MTMIAPPPVRPKAGLILDERETQIVPPLETPTEANPFPDRKRWTLNECTLLETTGVIAPGNYELLDGEIIEKVGQLIPHSSANLRVCFALSLTFGIDYVLMPVSLPVDEENVPKPDASVTKETISHYTKQHQRRPLPTDLCLAVEVSDTTLWRDRNTKMLLYAQAGVPEYWVLDVSGRKLWVHRNPSATGYADIQELDEAATVTPQAASEGKTPIRIADLLP